MDGVLCPMAVDISVRTERSTHGKEVRQLKFLNRLDGCYSGLTVAIQHAGKVEISTSSLSPVRREEN